MKNDSREVTGKAWILPCGRVVDVTLSEHALLARARMLDIPESEMHQRIPITSLFERLRPDEALNALAGADPKCVAFLEETCETSMELPSSSVDPRVYAIRQWDWIRTRKNLFYARQWCTTTQRRLLNSKEFWQLQPLGDAADETQNCDRDPWWRSLRCLCRSRDRPRVGRLG